MFCPSRTHQCGLDERRTHNCHQSAQSTNAERCVIACGEQV